MKVIRRERDEKGRFVERGRKVYQKGEKEMGKGEKVVESEKLRGKGCSGNCWIKDICKREIISFLGRSDEAKRLNEAMERVRKKVSSVRKIQALKNKYLYVQQRKSKTVF